MPPHGESWDVAADVDGKQIAFGLTPGAPHRLQNALAALASIHAAGLDAAALAQQLGHVGIMTGRGVEQTAGGVTVIDDSFNGNPASMVAALDSLKARPVKAGRRIAILGDMLELGADAPAYHTKLAGDLPGIDGVYCVGPLMRHLYDLVPAERALGWHEDPATLDPREIAALLQGRGRRGGQGQQKDVLGEQVCAKAAGRLAGKGVNWPELPSRCFRKDDSSIPRRMTKICLV